MEKSQHSFLDQHPQLRLSGDEDFHGERRHHLEVFGIHNLPRKTSSRPPCASCSRSRAAQQAKPPPKAQIQLHPETRLPFDTAAGAAENKSGCHLECNGMFSFAARYRPRAPNGSYPPGPPAAVFTCGFEPAAGRQEYGRVAPLSGPRAWALADGALQRGCGGCGQEGGIML
ncbi:hypothetical protein F4818DRAFT_446810 [Hypoxylon cercidicola]|nr:hypothetical protein F4818DRAFT_446810 [Hypoxylon cercidicola]